MRPEALLTGPLEPTNEAYAIAKLAGWNSAKRTASNTARILSRRFRPIPSGRTTISARKTPMSFRR